MLSTLIFNYYLFLPSINYYYIYGVSGYLWCKGSRIKGLEYPKSRGKVGVFALCDYQG